MSIDTLFRILPTRTPWPISWILQNVAAKVESVYLMPRLNAIFKLAEEQLKKSSDSFIAGGKFLTAADITIIYSFDAAFARFPALKTQYPACHAWLDRMLERPALVNALKKVNQEKISFNTTSN